MKIVDFTSDHIEAAIGIAKLSYETEKSQVPSLPEIDTVPDMNGFAQNGLGVTAFEGNDIIGFLCCLSPFKNAFRSTDATGVFSPMGANGAIGLNRAEVYARMYQAAGEKWANAGASSHAICLYAHDEIVQKQFFRYGFGMRTVDAIREIDGENFVCGTQGYLHIKGAFCLPEHRSTGISQKLLSMLVHKLRVEGYTRLGVDFESINPSGARFWLKHFSPYTCGVVRRIDEYALAKMI